MSRRTRWHVPARNEPHTKDGDYGKALKLVRAVFGDACVSVCVHGRFDNGPYRMAVLPGEIEVAFDMWPPDTALLTSKGLAQSDFRPAMLNAHDPSYYIKEAALANLVQSRDSRPGPTGGNEGKSR